ncbi:putative aspartic proteinase-like protein 1 isoform X1 [Iris pallida]|uniref:Aspartic proteinase-like protein 1 isoform X1 n=1 Tax=Iris pallida TaxID=29817 RepID=A0AAX6H775_IRIPA|nr:putative aspartic proteinase-like protein 1 isoform X1 [Iris pallida]
MENISVPSILSSVGLSSDSFSMCFRQDGIGRISFGDQGSLDQEETSFNINQMHPTYNISITGIVVGTSSTDVEFSALVDSGTSFTYLTDPAYTSLSENFHVQVQDNRHEPDARIPFEYCYDISSKDSTIQTPDVNLTTKGGSQFPVSDPIIVITVQEDEYVYCLAVVKSNKLNIIGQNFMTGLRIVFDRERLVLGWKSSNCYDAEGSSTLPSSPWNLSATSADGDNNYTPESPRGTGNHTYVAMLTPPFSCSGDLKYFNSTTSTFCFLLFSLIFFALGC